MSSRVESDVMQLKTTLEKAVASEASEETFTDAIEALKKIPVTIALLRKTNIGQTLQDIKKKYANNDVGNMTKVLLSKWKKDLEANTSSDDAGKKASAPKVDTAAEKTSKDTICAKSPRNNEEEEFVDDSHFDRLPPIRRKVMDMFVENFKLHTAEPVAKFLAFNVEASINAMHNADRDLKAYRNKAQTLTFNLKKNERLRQDIVEGRLQAEHLVHLTTSQLATDEVREERDQATKQADLARRGDLYEITRAAILQANGIDPNKGGEFCCRRCKGTKTTHYSLQTRSSDEPMTVFVCCLTCGNRWRCT